MNQQFTFSSTNKTVTEQKSNGIKSSLDINGLFQYFANLEGLTTIALLVFLILLSQFSGAKKGKISTGRVVGRGEKLAATNLALQQIEDRKHNKVTFWCGSPNYWFPGKFKNTGAKFQTIFGASPTVWIPHAERSTLVLGAPGSGKTFGTIDRMAESCMVQGFPLIVYDKKGDQMKLLAPLAARYGYKVWIFAPGEPYSEVINPLDFMENQEDAVTAAQIAQVINANAGGSGKSDEFFSKAADLLAKALIQLAKGSDRPDLAMVYCIQSTDGFINKLHAAVQAGRVSRWVAASFQQYLKAKDSEKTIASIDTTTVGIFSGFMQRSLLPSFIRHVRNMIWVQKNGRKE
jgi:type IV secretion system protein VirD4